MNFVTDCLEIIHAQDRTRFLRARALEGDTGAAALLREHFHLLYWEYEGRQIIPRGGNGGRGANGAGGGEQEEAPPATTPRRRRAGTRR
jgi:hypothetical protein